MNENRKNKLEEWQGMGTAALIVALFLVFICGISWLISCGLIYFICLCFDLQFKWKIATGVWIAMCILQSVFTCRNNRK